MEFGTNININNKDGETPLFYAYCSGNKVYSKIFSGTWSRCK